MSSLDALIQQRTGGAVNVRGVRVQILYTLWRALQAHAAGSAWVVTPEGLEDVDVREDGVTEHVQVKTSVNRWAPHQLKKALASVVEAAKACEGDPAHTFAVLLAGDANADVQALAERASRAPDERAVLDGTLAKLLRKAGAAPTLAADLATTLAIRVVDPGRLVRDLGPAAAEAFGAHPGGVDLVVQALAAFVLDRAQERAPFEAPDLTQAYAEIAHGQAVTRAFEARGRALIGPVDWSPTGVPEDFVEGRGTRPGHIAAGLDVDRPRWTDQIARVLAVTRLCVVRAPSGQGKSALAFRYAHDHWPAETTLALHSCNSPQEAAQVSDYLRARADLGLPTTLLVDGADWRLQHWPTVAAAARDRGIPVLATVRVEDWRRFAAGSAVDLDEDSTEVGDRPLADAAIVEPRLDLDEAHALFRQLRGNGRIHPSVRSAEEAYEQVGEPALLMEYLYLLTHGELLRHRLRGQIRDLRRRRDDPHLAVLRLATFAHACGVPAPAAALLADRPEDPQRVLSEIDGEYVRLQEDDLTELHRVRSEHLADLLHEDGLSPTVTAQQVLPFLPDDRLAPFVAGALRYPGVDRDGVFPALADLALARGPRATAALADGLFESGERDYIDALAPVYDKAEELFGTGAQVFLAVLLAPDPEPEIYDGLVDTFGKVNEAAAEGLRELRDVVEAAPAADRGHDAVRPLLAHVLPRLSPADVLGCPGFSGRVLEEGARLDLPAPAVPDVLAALAPPAPDGLPDAAALVLGLYAHAPEATERWVRSSDDLGEVVAEHLGLASPPALSEGPGGPAVDIVFYPDDHDDAPSVNDQAVSRLQLVRELYPFAVHFRSRAHWLLPDDLIPTHDSSVKDMRPNYLRPRLHRDRQGLRNVLDAERAAPPTFWAYQEAWHGLRTLGVEFAEAVERGLRAGVEGRSFDLAQALFGNGLAARLKQALHLVARPPAHTSAALTERLKGATDWQSDLGKVFHQVFQYAETQSPDTARILRFNAYETASKLNRLHAAFDALFEKVPDAFDLRGLRERERRAFAALAGAIEFKTDPPVPLPVKSLRKTLQEVHRRRDDELRQRVGAALAGAGVVPSIPPIILRDRLYTVAAFALPLAHPCDPGSAALEHVLWELARLGDPEPTGGRPDEVWIALTYEDARLEPTALRFFSHQLDRFAEDFDLNWESFGAHEPPSHVAEVLKALPVRPPLVYQAWKAACGVQLLHAQIEKHRDATEHPRAADRLPSLRDHASRTTRALARDLRRAAEDGPVPSSAADRLDGIAQAFASGENPDRAVRSLVVDLSPPTDH